MNIIEIIDGRYFLGIWYLYDAVNPAMQNQDWLATVFRDDGDARWHIRYRHKYYNSPDPFDEKDRRSSYSGTIAPCSEQIILNTMDAIVNKMIEIGGFRKDFIYIGSVDPEAITDRLKDRPWVHRKILEKTPAEFRKDTP
jgi:hypothetical protein